MGYEREELLNARDRPLTSHNGVPLANSESHVPGCTCGRKDCDQAVKEKPTG